MKQFLKDAKGHLMTGIGYMLPLIIGASLVVAIPKLIALCFGITSLDPYADGTGIWHIMKLIENVGWTGIGMVNTVLAGFIAYSIADKPAIGAGLIGGAVASNTYAGFLGAVIAAFIAGYSVKWAKKHIKLPESMNSVMPLVVCPLIATGLVAAICMPPLAYAIATVIRKNRFSEAFRETGKSNWAMGFVGITEGAIPFTLVKPQFLIPINMFGAAVGTAVISLLGAKGDIPPVGGIYGFVSITNGWAYLVGILVGALIIALLATLVVDFTEGDEGETEDIDVDEIEITFEDIN